MLTEMAVRVDGPGHCTVVGPELCGCGGGGGAPNPGAMPGEPGLVMTVPPISVLTSTPGPAEPGGLMANDTVGMLPPVWKNASRI